MTEEKEPAAKTKAIYPPAGGAHEDQVVACTRAFVVGDYGQARELADSVLASGEATPEEISFAGEVVSRIKMDPLAVGVGVACIGLFFLILALTL